MPPTPSPEVDSDPKTTKKQKKSRKLNPSSKRGSGGSSRRRNNSKNNKNNEIGSNRVRVTRGHTSSVKRSESRRVRIKERIRERQNSEDASEKTRPKRRMSSDEKKKIPGSKGRDAEEPNQRKSHGNGTLRGHERRKARKLREVPKPPQSPARPLSRAKLPYGTTLQTKDKMCFTVKKILGSGGFGDVYLVQDTSSGVEYAMKTEQRIKGKIPRLNHERHAYVAVEKQRKIDKKTVHHILQFFDAGLLPDLKFLIISLVGPSLDVLSEDYDLSWKTCCRLSLSTVEAIEQIHNLGLVHRDIKSANFSIGIKSDSSQVYVIDLGMCGKFPKEPSDVPEKSRYKFIGSLRYAPRAAHLRKAQTRKDDLESWLFMVFELFNAEALPWRTECDKAASLAMKEDAFKSPEILTVGAPDRFNQILKIVAETGMFDPPNYAGIRDEILLVAKDEKWSVEDRFEWEMEPEKEDPKEEARDLSKEIQDSKEGEKQSKEKTIDNEKLEKNVSKEKLLENKVSKEKVSKEKIDERLSKEDDHMEFTCEDGDLFPTSTIQVRAAAQRRPRDSRDKNEDHLLPLDRTVEEAPVVATTPRPWKGS